MALDFAYLEPRIQQILSAPGTDLSTISAKRVRRQLLETDSSLSAEYIKEHREEIDALITSVFEQISAEQSAKDEDDEYSGDESHSSRKRHHEDDDDGDGDEHTTGDRLSPPPKKVKKASRGGQKLSDEKLARKLSNEINGRERTTRTGVTGRPPKTKAKKGAKKSAATVDSGEESNDEDTPRKKTKKRASSGGGSGAKGGFAKEFVLSGPLSTVLQVDKLSRPQVVKQLWVYIKDKNLQNPTNKREILCNADLKAVFGREKVDMFTMNKILGQHLHEPES